MKPHMDPLLPQGEESNGWMLTFGDMTTLLLTFFVFLISISVFMNAEYRNFWEVFSRQSGGKPAATKAGRPELIKGLRLPNMPPAAREILDNVNEVLDNSETHGADIQYTENKITLLVPEELGFAPGTAELTPAMRGFLEKLLPQLRACPYDVKIEGHTDDATSPGIDNMELSLQRALATARMLIARGLPAARLAVAGYGPYRPIADNRTPEGRTLNRRVEIQIVLKN